MTTAEIVIYMRIVFLISQHSATDQVHGKIYGDTIIVFASTLDEEVFAYRTSSAPNNNPTSSLGGMDIII